MSLIIPDFIENKVYVGTRSSKLYACGLESAGASSTPLVTRIIPLNGHYHAQRLVIDFPNGIAASDSIAIQVQGKHGTEPFSFPRSHAQHMGTSTASKSLPQPHYVRPATLHIIAGAPSFSTVSLWSENAT